MDCRSHQASTGAPGSRACSTARSSCVALVLALRWTFPSGAVLERLALEAAARGWQLQAAEAGPAGLVGLSLREVTLKDKAGLTIPLDRIDLTLPLWPLLTGKRRVAVDAWLYDGRVRGAFDLAGGPQVYRAELDGVDLARALPLRMASGRRPGRRGHRDGAAGRPGRREGQAGGAAGADREGGRDHRRQADAAGRGRADAAGGRSSASWRSSWCSRTARGPSRSSAPPAATSS